MKVLVDGVALRVLVFDPSRPVVFDTMVFLVESYEDYFLLPD